MTEIILLDPRAEAPKKSTPGAAAWDIRAIMDGPVTLPAGDGNAHLIPTGFAMQLDPQYAALLLPRSGLGHKQGIVLGNLVGLIDGDYQGQVFVSLWNRGPAAVTINPFDRVAQMLIVPVYTGGLEVVSTFSQVTMRGAGGFGSTGTS